MYINVDLELDGKYEHEFKQIKVLNDSKYTIPPGSFSTGGLSDVDFGITKFYSIFIQDG